MGVNVTLHGRSIYTFTRTLDYNGQTSYKTSPNKGLGFAAVLSWIKRLNESLDTPGPRFLKLLLLQFNMNTCPPVWTDWFLVASSETTLLLLYNTTSLLIEQHKWKAEYFDFTSGKRAARIDGAISELCNEAEAKTLLENKLNFLHSVSDWSTFGDAVRCCSHCKTYDSDAISCQRQPCRWTHQMTVSAGADSASDWNFIPGHQTWLVSGNVKHRKSQQLRLVQMHCSFRTTALDWCHTLSTTLGSWCCFYIHLTLKWLLLTALSPLHAPGSA